jgi:hypothetical protein
MAWLEHMDILSRFNKVIMRVILAAFIIALVSSFIISLLR